MVRLYLIAEGLTEQTFADEVLKPHLASSGVFLSALCVCTSQKKNKKYRGGGRSYLTMKNDLLRLMKQEKGADVFFTTMIDLYAIYQDMPGREEAESLRHVPYLRVKDMETKFADDIGDLRFVPYIQLHEYEAYLFVDVSKFGFIYKKAEKPIERLRAVAESHESPELIDDGPATAPSKRIIKEFPDYEHAKLTVGSQLAQLIGLAAIRAKCRHFDEWVTQLEGLGSGGAGA